MKKRIIALVLSFVIIFSLLSHIIVYADSNNYEYRVVNIFRSCKNNKSKYEKLLVLKDSSGNLYMSSEDIARYTIYYFDKTTQTFYFDNNTAKNPGLKNITVDKEKKCIKTFSKKITLTNIIEDKDDLYFPMAEILPYLNADICVYDDAIGIISDGISLWQILDGFNAESYYFDVDKELYNGYFTFAFVSTNYFFDTLFNPPKWRRLPVGIASIFYNEIKEYEIIMKDYMVLESDTIAQASKKMSSITDALITGQETINTSELLNWIAIATNCLSEADKDAYYMYFGGRMESIAQSARFINEKIGNNKFLSDNDLLDKLGITMAVLDKTIQCYSANKDCYESLNKVYKYEDLSPRKEAASIVYDLYKTDFGKGISILFDSLEETMYNEVLNSLSIANLIILAYNLTRLAFSLIGLDEVYGSAAVLLYVCRLQDDGLAAYKSYMKNLDYKYDTNEGIRLSLIYYLRMSQTCYGTLEKAYSYSRMKTETKECKNKQAEIDKIVASLLAAGNACMHDSIDKVKENVNAAKKAIKTATTYDGQEFIETLKDIQLQNEQYKTNSIDSLSGVWDESTKSEILSISKNGYTYHYGNWKKGEYTDVSIIIEGSENYWSHDWIIKKDNKTEKSKAIIKDADGGIAVTDKYIYYVSNVYDENGAQGFLGVNYVRTDLNGKNKEVLYFDNYTPFGTGVGSPPTFLVTKEYLYISKYKLVRIDLNTKDVDIIIDSVWETISSEWLDLDFIINGNYYFYVYDCLLGDATGYGNDGFFGYTNMGELKEIIVEYYNYKGRKSTLKRAGLKDKSAKFDREDKFSDNTRISNYSYATDAPFSYLGIKYEDKKTGKKYFYRFADEKLAEIK